MLFWILAIESAIKRMLFSLRNSPLSKISLQQMQIKSIGKTRKINM